MARRNRVLPTYSNRPPVKHSPPGQGKHRHRHPRHHSLFTQNTVWLHWLDLPINKLGILLRVTRIAKRRGKSKRWIQERFRKDVKRYNQHWHEQDAKLKEIYNQMQQDMLSQENDGRTEPDAGT